MSQAMTLEQAKAALTLYVEQHEPPGPFLTMVLSNHLSGSVAYAGRDTEMILGDLVRFIASDLPPTSHGCAATVHAWLNRKKAA